MSTTECSARQGRPDSSDLESCSPACLGTSTSRCSPGHLILGLGHMVWDWKGLDWIGLDWALCRLCKGTRCMGASVAWPA